VSKPAYAHWTCWHGQVGIDLIHKVVPNQHTGLSWWTDLRGKGHNTRKALCLTSNYVACDRMALRYFADPRDHHLLIPWVKHRNNVSPALVWELEGVDGVQPEHWFVATEKVRVMKR